MLLPRDAASSAHFAARDIGWQALGPALGCTLLATIVVVARWYTRCCIAKCSGLDDYVILLSLILSWTMTALIGAELHDSLGLSSAHLSPTTIAKLVVINNNLWILIVTTTKTSILLQYLRLFRCPTLRLLTLTLLILLLPAATWGIFGGTFLCSPTAKLWNPALPGACMNARAYWFSVAGLDIGLDFLILLLPMPAISRLRLPRKQKATLVAVFTLGFAVCAVSVLRVATVLVTNLEADYVASGIWAIVWSAVEANVGIVCASLVALKPLLREWFPRLVVDAEPGAHSTRLPMILDDGPEVVEAVPRVISWPVPARLAGWRREASGTLAESERRRVSRGESRLSRAKTVSYGGSASSPRMSEGRENCGEETAWHMGLERHRERLSIYDMLKEDTVDHR